VAVQLPAGFSSYGEGGYEFAPLQRQTSTSTSSGSARDQTLDASNSALESLAQASLAQTAAAQQVFAAQNALANRQLELANSISREQMEISRREVAIAERQLAMAQDFYEYSMEFRPLERQMLGRVFEEEYGVVPQETQFQQYIEQVTDAHPELDQQMRNASERMYMDQAQLYEQYRPYVEQQVGQALADATGGFTRSAAQLQRAGLRFGMAPDAAMFGMGELGLQRAQTETAVANAARQGAFDDIRARAAVEYDMAMRERQDIRDRGLQGFGMTSQLEDMRRAEDATKWGRQIDVAGLGRGLIGASQGAYGLAGQSLSSAAQTGATTASISGQAAQLGMMPGRTYLAGLADAANTRATGHQLQLGGLGNVLTADANAATNSTARRGQNLGVFGSILGFASSLPFSDRRLKQNIERVGFDPDTGLPLYEFEYRSHPGMRYRGVMADDVEPLYPEAVVHTSSGYAAVDYPKLGIELERVA
jgi:hypothetical protein